MRRWGVVLAGVGVALLIAGSCTPTTPPVSGTDVRLSWRVRPNPAAIPVDADGLALPADAYAARSGDIAALQGALAYVCSGSIQTDLGQFGATGCVGGPAGSKVYGSVLAKAAPNASGVLILKSAQKSQFAGQAPANATPEQLVGNAYFLLPQGYRKIPKYLNLSGAPDRCFVTSVNTTTTTSPNATTTTVPPQGCETGNCPPPSSTTTTTTTVKLAAIHGRSFVPNVRTQVSGGEALSPDAEYRNANGSPCGEGRRWTNTCNPFATAVQNDSLTEVPGTSVARVGILGTAWASVLYDEGSFLCTL
ncbi:MAG: hypothetical protein ACKOYM_11350 [Actinomycetes bacterium]